MTQYQAALFQGQQGVLCVYSAEEPVLSLEKNFAVPDIASSLQGEACCFSATCDWTLKKEQLPPEPKRKCQ
jgi:hypothetical protein